jgi:hypothetical protein
MRRSIRYSLAGFALLLWACQQAPAIAGEDPKRFCAPDGANLVLLLDVTTPYDQIDKTALVDGVGHIFEELKGGERIVIRTIEDSFSNSHRLLDACVPYCPDGGFFGDLFSSCTEGVVINEKKALRRNLVQQLSTLLDSAHELDHSEIIRTLAMALKEEGHPNTENRIFVFSDMIENSTYLSGKDFFATKDATLIERLEHDDLLPAAWQADVRIFGIGRGGTPGSRTALPQQKLQKLTTFWTKYFAAGGGTLHMSQNLDLN